MNEDIKIYREKNWVELSDCDKITRIHDVVKRLINSNSKVQTKVNDLLHHQHGNDGKLLIPLKNNNCESEESSRLSNDWF